MMLHFEDKYMRFLSKKDCYAFYNEQILNACKIFLSNTDTGLAVLAGCTRSFISEIRSGVKLIPYLMLKKWINLIQDETTIAFIELAYTDSIMSSIYLKN